MSLVIKGYLMSIRSVVEFEFMLMGTTTRDSTILSKYRVIDYGKFSKNVQLKIWDIKT